ncbi:hypothetical protein F9L33_07365 [Amylibacter sp. SFDW26]|uniref:hypothetical protein n=1 Tax=Amylibacter sp. SFDW26 TaxID=2652722 RepID=UPI0012627493|nr:hypothetical protein [Amylibacter sp. SFDW26]KAB7614453.1 hypothetical protein F9L33_07365 [Amylibacter sp. SFDW26]
MKTSRLIALTVSGAIALTAVATPASAASDGDRLAQFLFGAAAIGAIAHVVHKDKKKRRQQEAARRQHYEPKPVYQNHKPRHCLRQKWTNHGWKKYYSRKCLKQHGYGQQARHDYNDYHSHGSYQHSHKKHYKKHHHGNNQHVYHSDK